VVKRGAGNTFTENRAIRAARDPALEWKFIVHESWSIAEGISTIAIDRGHPAAPGKEPESRFDLFHQRGKGGRWRDNHAPWRPFAAWETHTCRNIH
jgi:hypothetical protein